MSMTEVVLEMIAGGPFQRLQNLTLYAPSAAGRALELHDGLGRQFQIRDPRPVASLAVRPALRILDQRHSLVEMGAVDGHVLLSAETVDGGTLPNRPSFALLLTAIDPVEHECMIARLRAEV